MKTLDSIPTSKIQRATKLVTTGAKVGVNYLKYYGDKLVNNEVDAKSRLNENNAEDIYDGLKQLKGSALKVAQMLSMEKSILPAAYVEKFSLSQFSVPPLSPPLVIKTFKKYLGKSPNELFDSFNATSVNAASIGQVHQAKKNGKKLAIKLQYPGVADSISSDLSLVKPIAVKMFNLKGKDTDKYFDEVEGKLIEETNYLLEVKQSKLIREACKGLPNIKFPNYYTNLSSERIISMDWMEGVHLSEYVVQQDEGKQIRNQLGQTLWDFYMFQIHGLKKVQADPHPGNFMVDEDRNLIAIDFGCMKSIPEDFYHPYFELSNKESIEDLTKFDALLRELEILLPTDSKEEVAYFTELFQRMMRLFTLPFHDSSFDFADAEFWNAISTLSKDFAGDSQLRKMNGNRGSKHFIYINRTFFGLYHLLYDLKAEIQTESFKQYL